MALLCATFGSTALAQTPSCVDPIPGTVASPPLTYPKMSGRYGVQYKLDDEDWKDATVYISVYGGTKASPFFNFSPYVADTSHSFTSIPARANARVQLRITKLWDGPFVPTDHVSIRPSAKHIEADLDDGIVQITRQTGDDFAGEQFVLWWDRGSEGGAIEALAFYLNPPYESPSAGNVDTVTGVLDPAADLSGFDTLIFQGMVTIGDSGARTLPVPPNITTVYFAPGSWVQGKLRFKQDGNGRSRKIYGPGVLDVSRFEYKLRDCAGEQHDSALGFEAPPVASPQIRDQFLIDGIVVSDTNRYSTDFLDNATINNIKTLGWNGNTDGLEFGTIASASNVFVRSGDDSLKMWGAFTKVTNATVWQNYNGGVINLGWFDNSPGENSLIDGVYVVKTDWYQPSAPTFVADKTHSIDHLNNGVITSQMVPGTNFGLLKPSLYRNIFVEDSPQVLFSLKIFPPRENDPMLVSTVDLTQSSVLNLNIANLFTPPSQATNLIGFDSLPQNYVFLGTPFPNGLTFTGTMNIGLHEVELLSPDGRSTDLNAQNAAGPGMIDTSGPNVVLDFDSDSGRDLQPRWFSAWTAPQGLEITPDNPLDNHSVRMVVRPAISGTSVRVKLENNMGDFPVKFHDAFIGQVLSGAGLVPNSNVQLTFGGRPDLTLDPRHGAYSDPLEFPVTAFTRYAVSLDVEKAPDISAHELGLVTNYVAEGFLAAATSDTGFAAVPNLLPAPPHEIKGGQFPVYWVAALDVASEDVSGTVVALGDSITDGACSTRTDGGGPKGKVIPDLYNRWTDLLAARFAQLPDGQSKAVTDEGIAGNEVAGGVDSALFRIANDVLGREGVTHVIYLEGTNDLAPPELRTAATVIAADQRIIDDAHLIGLKIIGATLLPRGGDPTWGNGSEHERRVLNDWIRHTANFDGVIDFDALMHGYTDPTSMLPAIPPGWSCFDGTHPNTAGYAAMAGYINFDLFRKHDDHDESKARRKE